MSYDNYLLNEAEKHNRDCEPKVASAEKEHEGRDEYGNLGYSINYTFNCQNCDNTECEHWCRFNGN